MWKNRAIWGGWILAMLNLLIFTDNYAIQIILCLSLLFPIIGILCGSISAKKIDAEIKGDISRIKGAPLNYRLVVRNDGRISCSKGTAFIELENMLTGEVSCEEIAFSIGPKQTKEFELQRTFENCGKVKITLKNIYSWDFIGAFFKKVNCFSETRALILPKTYPLEINMTSGNQTDLNSDEYSMYKSGFDPSETFEIREYRPGDNIKNIHWKLSEKLQDVIVRELSLPINNTVLLLLDNSYTVEQHKTTPRVLDAIGETVISIAQVLCHQQIPFQMAWYDREDGTIQVVEVMNIDDLSSAISGVLSAATELDQLSVLEHFKEDVGQLQYAHIIVVGANMQAESTFESADNIVTNFVCVDDHKPQDLMVGNGFVLYFTPETMSKDLLYIEV